MKEKMKAKYSIVFVGLVAGLALQVLAVDFESNPSRRLEVPHLRKASNTQKSTGVQYYKAQTGNESTTASNRQRRRQTTTQTKASLVPEGFGEDDDTPKSKSAVASSHATASQKVLSAEGQAIKDDIKVEYGEGHGETIDEALKEAMKDVLQKVVGVYVDSDFRMNNDKIIKDEIITHCNGFIDHYKKMEESEDANGRGKVVTIKAWVRMRDFVNRMKKMAPSDKVKLDGVLLDNDLSNKINAETLLKKELEHLNPAMDLMEVRLIDSIRPVVRSTSEDAVTLRYVFQIRYSKTKYYQEFIPRLSRVLDQIAVAKHKERDLTFTVDKVQLQPSLTDNDYPEGWSEQTVTGFVLRSKNYWYGNLAGQKEKPEKSVSAIVKISRGGSAQVKEWILTERLMDVYNNCRGNAYEKSKEIRCKLTLLDSEGEVVAQASCGVSRHFLMGDMNVQRTHVDCVPDYVPFARLWHWGNVKGGYDLMGSWTDRYVGCIDVTIDREDVARIKSAEIKLETNDEGANE